MLDKSLCRLPAAKTLKSGLQIRSLAATTAMSRTVLKTTSIFSTA
jgi:hypothetical protein